MNKIQKTLLYIAAFLIAGCLFIIFFINEKKKDLTEITQDKTEQIKNLEQQRALYRQKSNADELFIAGKYNKAMKIYSSIADSIDNNAFLKNRKATIARFNYLRSELDSTQSMSNDQLTSMERELDKQINEIQKKYQLKLDSIKNELNAKIASLNKTIDQKERLLQNKANLGRLTFYNANGTKISYFGEVQFGKANGEGVGHYSSNSVYDGDWKNNMKHGKGTYKWVDGHKYVGEYKNDKREGTGTYYWNTGEKYEGQWKNDKRNGQGTLYDSKGNIKLKGEWENDELM